MQEPITATQTHQQRMHEKDKLRAELECLIQRIDVHINHAYPAC